MSESFVWQMDGINHSESVGRLVAELNGSFRDREPFEISRFFDLLPILTPQRSDAERRGAMIPTESGFTNSGDEPLELSFADPAMGEFTMEIPAQLHISLHSNDEEELEIQFGDSPLFLTVPRIEELALGPSKFQLVTRIHVTRQSAVTTCIDKLSEAVELAIEVQLSEALSSPVPPEVSSTPEARTDLATFTGTFVNMGDFCDVDDDASGPYYVIRRSNGSCVVSAAPNDPRHPGVVVFSGENIACNRWMDENCNVTC